MKQEIHQNKKVRLSVNCTEQERMYIKMLATKNHMTISEYFLSFARNEMPKCKDHHCKRSHKPNKETALVLQETDQGMNLIEPLSLDEFWGELGFNKHT